MLEVVAIAGGREVKARAKLTLLLSFDDVPLSEIKNVNSKRFR